ncbi:hypothetical protein AM2_0908 [Lactococcus cremoris]|uniref:Uncharacterized protein n=1 Tax=Lactococcus cremoris subsp. cremoris TIFN3 TaxID=1234873 RepID=T0WNV2_LACLC|nr:hypothetical protein LLT1_10840 [Lactococcus cremoris subsp. cremoris TIFN1]EQC94328.1 hypothetical protein LLT3_07295 [Lactococcus cremoris subsp. cremoris TIFN3]KZK46901.1 hypothetical protein FG2_1318 [Lactococcus cremoris]KZK48236.1 hypothetical protein B40_0163 [Lactococcus cremoris]KZK49163.1 hypothetical protein SK110_0531 [Lactococcus cremoris]
MFTKSFVVKKDIFFLSSFFNAFIVSKNLPGLADSELLNC